MTDSNDFRLRRTARPQTPPEHPLAEVIGEAAARYQARRASIPPPATTSDSPPTLPSSPPTAGTLSHREATAEPLAEFQPASMRAVGTVTLAGVHPGVVAKIKSAFATNNWPIYIWGLPGRGKSGAAKVVYEDMVGSRVWWRAADLCTDIAAIRMGGSLTRSRGDLVWQETERSIWNKLDAARFAVIDDLGTRDPSGASYDVLLSATDYRARKPTIWTGNLSPVDLAKLYDARLVSRICCGVVIEIRGPDRRLATAETCVFG